MKYDKGINKIKHIISCILVIIIIFCLYKIIYKQYEYHIANEQTQKIQHVMNLNSENIKEPSFFNKLEISKIIINANKLKDINSDYQGWLIVNGTNVNYPVVQTNNDNYYLHNSFYKEKSIEGNPFIYDKTNVNECLNLSSTDSNNMIIFGHNMRNGTMFESISNFKDTKFFDDHKYIEFIRNGKVYVYEIFGDAVVHANYPYIVSTFNSDDSFYGYIAGIKQQAYFWRDIPVKYGDNILTLSTCSYEFNNARFIVLAKLIKVIGE